MRAGLVILAIVVVAAVVAALNSLFIINPTQQALVLQFGQVKNTIREPGLNAKVPFIQDVLILDKRILDLNVPAQEIIAADQMVDSVQCAGQRRPGGSRAARDDEL